MRNVYGMELRFLSGLSETQIYHTVTGVLMLWRQIVQTERSLKSTVVCQYNLLARG